MKRRHKGFQDRARSELAALIRGPYSELAAVQIDCRVAKTREGEFETSLSWERCRITIDRRLHKASARALRGGLAHELEHIVYYRKLGPFFGWLDLQLCDLFEWYEIRDERRTDLAAIRRGFGPDLIALYEESVYEYDPTDGLSPDEIRALLAAPAFARVR